MLATTLPVSLHPPNERAVSIAHKSPTLPVHPMANRCLSRSETTVGDPHHHRTPQSPRHFFERLYGHLENNSANAAGQTTVEHAGDIGVDSVVSSRSVQLGQPYPGTSDALLAMRTSPIHSPGQHSNMSESSADISDTRTECTRHSTPPTISHMHAHDSHSPPDLMMMASAAYPSALHHQHSLQTSYNAAHAHYQHHHQQHHHHQSAAHHYHHQHANQHPHQQSSTAHLTFMSPPHHFNQFRPMLGMSPAVDQLPAGLTAFLARRRRKEGRPRRQRTTFSSDQTLRLEVEFHRNEYISRGRRFELAETLRLSETQIKIWFQNRRAKDKRIEKAQIDQQYRHFAVANGFMSYPTSIAPPDSSAISPSSFYGASLGIGSSPVKPTMAHGQTEDGGTAIQKSKTNTFFKNTVVSSSC